MIMLHTPVHPSRAPSAFHLNRIKKRKAESQKASQKHDQTSSHIQSENPVPSIESMSGWWLGHPSEKYEFVSWDN